MEHAKAAARADRGNDRSAAGGRRRDGRAAPRDVAVRGSRHTVRAYCADRWVTPKPFASALSSRERTCDRTLAA